MNNDNVEIGQKFSKFSDLVRGLGEEPKKGNEGIAQKKRVNCYVEYEKTGKVVRGKETNEIVITWTYDDLEIEENLENLSKVGRPSVYAQWFYDWIRSYPCNYAEYVMTTKEFIYNCYLTNKDSGLLDTYVDVDTWMNMNKEERRIISKQKEYIFALTEEFKHKILSALKEIKETYPTFIYRKTYKITEDEEREEWYEASPEEVEVIKREIQNCQDKMVRKYNKNFNTIKFDVVLFDEYNEMLQQSLYDLLGLYGHVWAIAIEPCEEILESYDYYEDLERLELTVKPTICKLMGKRMEDILSKKGYDQTKHNNKKSVLGNKESKAVQWVFTLKFCNEVIDLHTQLFGEINKEVVYGNSEEEYSLYLWAKSKKKKDKLLVEEKEILESCQCEDDPDYPF